jgi:hypothetical protein
MANHGHDVTMPARPRSQNAKTILGVVVGYSLDKARQHLLGRRFGLWTHADYPGPVGPIKRPSARTAAGCLSLQGCIFYAAPASTASARAGWSAYPSCGTREEENGDRLCGLEVPDDSDNRPVFAPETREQSVSKRGEGDEGALYSLNCFAERSLHTGEVVGSIPTAPTTKRQQAQDLRRRPLRFPPRFEREQDANSPIKVGENWGALFDACSGHRSVLYPRNRGPSAAKDLPAG